MRLGYSFWGFLADMKLDKDGNVLSAPDGNATYSWSIIHEAQRRKWKVYSMQEDRDLPAFQRHGHEIFRSFSHKKRSEAYGDMIRTNGFELPELDILLIEWRFRIPGRNCMSGEFASDPAFMTKLGMQPDLARQFEILRHYKEQNTRIIFWDLDHKLTEDDEDEWRPDSVFETSCHPKYQACRRTKVEPPIVISDLLQFPTVSADPNKMVAYIGSRYERDTVIDRYLGKVAAKHPGKVHFYGKWEPRGELTERWPGIVFHDRCTVQDFREIYQDAGCVPLLAKESYLQTGFITPRPWEALLFGSLPIGLSEGRGMDRYVLDAGQPGEDMVEAIETMAGAPLASRRLLREENVEAISFMDVRHFVDEIERIR